MEAIISHVVDISHVLSSSDMHCHIIWHIVVYHRVSYGYHRACNGYHLCERMMITVACNGYLHCHCIHVMAYHMMISHHMYAKTMMITVTCTMINVTYRMIYHYMSDVMIVHV